MRDIYRGVDVMGLTEVPEYRRQLLESWAKDYGQDVAYWDNHNSDARFYVDEDGVVYLKTSTQTILGPEYDDPKITLLPGHKLDEEAIYRCLCGSRTFEYANYHLMCGCGNILEIEE